MTPQRAAQAVLAAMPAGQSGRPIEAPLTAVDMVITPAGVVTGIDAVEVQFPGDVQRCRWLGGFAAEVVAAPAAAWPGRRGLQLTLGDMPVVVGTIHEPTPEVEDIGV